MSEVNGKLVTCDRCGTNVFLKYTGEKYGDGGFTRRDVYEEIPNGWEHHVEVGMLCPACNTEWNNIVASFKSYVVEVEG